VFRDELPIRAAAASGGTYRPLGGLEVDAGGGDAVAELEGEEAAGGGVGIEGGGRPYGLLGDLADDAAHFPEDAEGLVAVFGRIALGQKLFLACLFSGPKRWW
jgi:hypothetical protein